MRIGLAMLFLFACAQSPAPPAATEGTTAAAAAARGPRVVFPDGFVVNVELAANDELRAQGLMYRDQLRPGTGMLFLFAHDEEHSFWMKNTRIPLDMVWIDASRKIVGIRANVPPCTADPCPSYGPEPAVRSRYVLEVAAGVAAEHGLKVGDPLRFEEIDGVEIR
jgi:uncharacterized membrane protein (UPF0127 family)